MAVFQCQVSKISRSKGQSAVASAAYYADEVLTDHRSGLRHAMPRRPGLLHREILVPADARWPTSLDRQWLWNAVEAREKRRDANTALLWFVALPAELSGDANIALARSFAALLIDRYGCVIDLTIRDTGPGKPIGFILATTRRLSTDGFGEKIDFVLDGPGRVRRGLAAAPRSDVLALRASWAEMVNAALAEAGSPARVDHRSLKDQGFDFIPQTHLGSAAARRTRRGEDIDRKSGSVERDVHNAREILKEPDIIRRLLESRGERFDAESARRAIDRFVDDGVLREELYELCIPAAAAP